MVQTAKGKKKVCAMRKQALAIYNKHFATFDAQLETAMAVPQARRDGTARPPPIDWKTVCATGIYNGEKYQCYN